MFIYYFKFEFKNCEFFEILIKNIYQKVKKSLLNQYYGYFQNCKPTFYFIPLAISSVYN